MKTMNNRKKYVKPSIYVVDVDTDNDFMTASAPEEEKKEIIEINEGFYGDAKPDHWGFNGWDDSLEDEME